MNYGFGSRDLLPPLQPVRDIDIPRIPEHPSSGAEVIGGLYLCFDLGAREMPPVEGIIRKACSHGLKRTGGIAVLSCAFFSERETIS